MNMKIQISNRYIFFLPIIFSLSGCVISKPANIPQAYVNHIFKCTGGITAGNSFDSSIKAAIDEAKTSASIEAKAALEAKIESIITNANLSEPVRLKMLDCIQKDI